MRLKELSAEARPSPEPPTLYPRKMIVKHGAKHILLDTQDVVYCYSNNKIVYIVDVTNQKYVADKNLLHLEADLDPRLFFKANRTHIINFNHIRSFVSHERNKMKVELKSVQKEQYVVISQTRVNAFRQWLYQQL
jgi:DNA-binding LytR/AlgR family response regulator